MEWYLPITIIPGIGILIMSTTNQLMAINSDIAQMISTRACHLQKEIFEIKNRQLKKLARATELFYISSALYVCAGLLDAFINKMIASEIVLFIGTICLFTALGDLIMYGKDLIKIQKLQIKNLNNQTT